MSKCENCIHYDVCTLVMAKAKHLTEQTVRKYLNEGNACTDHFKDKSLFVELPCKVGDTVYYLNTQYHMALYRNTIYEAKVARIVATSLGVALVIHIRDESGCCEIPDVKDFGKTVFLTKEEAEAKLKELQI